MNERIQELAEQCTYRYESSNGSGEYETFDKEKFAELIVRECSQYIEDKFDFCGDEIIIAEKIKEHFGVDK